MLSPHDPAPPTPRSPAEASPGNAPFLVVAHHPHWRSSIVLDPSAKRVRLMANNSFGHYTIEGSELRIDWDDFPADHFHLQDGVYLHRFTEPPKESRQPLLDRQILLASIPASPFIAQLRRVGSDIAVFQQVFINADYASPHLPQDADVIIDLGANIGLTSLFFAAKYPNARIIAIEPDPGNFALLSSNLAQISPRAMTLPIAIWSSDCELHVRRTDVNGNPLGDWGVQVGQSVPGASITVRGRSMGRLIDDLDLQRIDIVKIDIEGAEKELFEASDLAWLEVVNMIIVETHERFRPGAHDAVLRLLDLGFSRQGDAGENCVFTRVKRAVRASPFGVAAARGG
jgi:FkbM family methyltransferase